MSAWTKLNLVESPQPSLVNRKIESETLHEFKGTLWEMGNCCHSQWTLFCQNDGFKHILKPEIEKIETKRVKKSPSGPKFPNVGQRGLGKQLLTIAGGRGGLKTSQSMCGHALCSHMSRCTVIRTFLAIFPTAPKSYATIFFGAQRTLYWSN